MPEFDPFVFLSWFVPLVVSTIFGIFMYITKNSWLKGSTQTKTEDTINTNQNLITNAIKEIEQIRVDLKALFTEIQLHKIDNIKLEERIKYMAVTLEAIRDDIKSITKDNKEQVDKFDDWRKREQR